MILRELLVKLGLKVDRAEWEEGHIVAALLKDGLEQLFEVVKEGAEKFVELVKETAEAGAQIEELSKITGVGTESLQNLMTAAQYSNVATGELSHTIGVLSRNLYEAKKGGSEAEKTFHKLGIRVKDSHGKLRGADDVLYDLADKFKVMPDGVEKTALAMQVLGRSGKELIPLLNEGREGIEKLAASAPNLTEEQIEASKSLVKTQRELGIVVKNMWQRAIAPLLPEIDKLLKRYLAWKKAGVELMRQRIEAFFRGIITAVKILVSVVQHLIKNFEFLTRNWIITLGILATLAIRFNILSAAAVRSAISTAAAWVSAAAPILAVVAAVTALYAAFDDLRVFVEGGDSLIGRFKKDIEDLMTIQPEDSGLIKMLKLFLQLVDEALNKVAELSDYLGLSDKQKREYAEQKLRDKNARNQDTFVGTHKVTRRRGNVVIGDLGRKNAKTGQIEGDALVTGVYGPGTGKYDNAGGSNRYTDEHAVEQARGTIGAGREIIYRDKLPPQRTAIVQHNRIVVHADGVKAEQVKPMIKEVLREHHDEANEAAAASFPAVP